jgi:hypothetical protein
VTERGRAAPVEKVAKLLSDREFVQFVSCPCNLLSEKLRADSITVGEVVILGIVKGGAFDTGGATIEPGAVADKFWEIYSDHESRSVTAP